MVKDRQEPSHVVQMCEILASIKGLPVAEVAAATYRNSMQILFPSEIAAE